MLEKIQQKFSRNKLMQNTKSTFKLRQKWSPDVTRKNYKPGALRQTSQENDQKLNEKPLASSKKETSNAGNIDNNAKDKGYAMVEMLLVMILFMLIGITIMTLIFSGGSTYSRLNDNKNIQAEARIAMSYLNVKLRQNDSEGSISLEDMSNGQKAIRIKEESLGEGWSTWIFWDDGALWESQIEDEIEPSIMNGIEIVKIDGFDVTFNDEKEAVTSTITYSYNDIPRTMSHTIRLRAGLRGGS